MCQPLADAITASRQANIHSASQCQGDLTGSTENGIANGNPCDGNISLIAAFRPTFQSASSVLQQWAGGSSPNIPAILESLLPMTFEIDTLFLFQGLS